MKELYVFCEGQTEQNFCKQVLAPHLYTHGYTHVATIRVAFSRHKGIVYRGGVLKYEPVRKDILNTMKGRGEAWVYFTTMLDLYRLPNDFPGKNEYVRIANDPAPYVEALEAAWAADIVHPRLRAALATARVRNAPFLGTGGFCGFLRELRRGNRRTARTRRLVPQR